MTKNLFFRLLSALLFSLFGLTSAWAQFPTQINDQLIRTHAVASFPEYLELLTLPNDAMASARDIQINADHLEKLFQKRGFNTRQFANKGRPLVLADYPAVSGMKTVLFYLHFDGQPVIASQWAQPSPWQAVLKKKDSSGKWQIVDMKELMQPDFDPELRVFARAAADDKGPIMMFLAAIDLLRAQGIAPAVNIKVILDSEEEINSPGMSEAVSQHKDFLRADALVIHDMATHASGRPTIIFGNRGVQTLSLTVYGARAPLHSGHYGNFIPNPAFNLVRLLASMKNDQGQVSIPGYYASTKLNAEDLRVLDAVGDDETALKQRVGVKTNDQVAGNYQRSLQYPSLNIRGLSSASVGNEAANIIPKEAVAEIDIRTTTDANAAYLSGLIKKHIQRQGFHIIDHAPTDAERLQYPKIIQVKEGLPAEAARQPLDTKIRYWAEKAQINAFSEGNKRIQPIMIRAAGGTVPTHEIVSPLGLPFVIIPTVNSDNNQHTYDENLRMGNYLTGMRSMIGLLTSPYQ